MKIKLFAATIVAFVITAVCFAQKAPLPKSETFKVWGNCGMCKSTIEKAAKEAGYDIKVGKFPFVASGKATAAGARDGFVKVIYDAKYGELLGAHMIGYNVTELIAEAVVVRKLESTAYEIMKSIHPHPTISEAFKGATEAAYGEAVDL